MALLVQRFFAGLGVAALGVFVSGAQLLPAQDVTHQLVLPKEGETVPSYEVATVRAAAERGDGVMMRFMFGADRCEIDNLELRSIIVQAYGAVWQDEIVGGPAALMEEHFDINAKADANDAAQMKNLSREDRNRESRLMLQSLLADRFHLKVHIETKELPVYALVVAKGGAKLKASAAPPAASAPDEDAPPGKTALSPDQLPKTPPRGGMTIRMSSTNIEASATDGTMEGLVNVLTNQPDAGGRVVIDRTGLTGKYDWKLTWAPVRMNGAPLKEDNGTGAQGDVPGLFTAVEEQLGLKLEPQKGPVEVVVVDHVEAPSAN
jgi:uncharacterized protein (TIGR03435 family)